MNGLDKVIAAIVAVGQQKSEEIIAEAQQSASAIVAEGRREGQKHAMIANDRADHACDDIAVRARSTQQQTRRHDMLVMQNQEIESVLEQAKSHILALPVDQYFDFLAKLFAKNALDRDGEISFCQEDIDRLPGDFLSRCQSVYPGRKLTLGKAIDEKKGGFVLDYGRIFVNCTIDEIFRANRLAMRDKVNSVFSEG